MTKICKETLHFGSISIKWPPAARSMKLVASQLRPTAPMEKLFTSGLIIMENWTRPSQLKCSKLVLAISITSYHPFRSTSTSSKVCIQHFNSKSGSLQIIHARQTISRRSSTQSVALLTIGLLLRTFRSSLFAMMEMPTVASL